MAKLRRARNEHASFKKAFPLMTHPALRIHPETSRAALYVNEYYSARINELFEVEKESMLAIVNQGDFNIVENIHPRLLYYRINQCWNFSSLSQIQSL